jgi:hypothetical protein
MTLNDIYRLLRLSPKSRQAWKKRVLRDYIFPHYWDETISHDFWLDIRKYCKHGNIAAVDAAYNIKHNPSGNSHSAPQVGDFPDQDKLHEMMGLKDKEDVHGIHAENIMNPWTFMLYKGTLEKDFAELRSSVMAIQNQINDLSIIILNTPVNKQHSPRKQIVGLIDKMVRNGDGTHQKLFNRLYAQYDKIYGGSFLKNAHEAFDHKRITKLEYAERIGIINNLLSLLKSW